VNFPRQTTSILPRTQKSNHMATNIITSEDLEQFKWEFLDLIKEHIDQRLGKITPVSEERQWLKSHQVQRMLGISPGTLQTLRINGTIPYTKVGGIIFYDKKDIHKIMEDNMRNKLDH
jgi:hypothetical protein